MASKNIQGRSSLNKNCTGIKKLDLPGLEVDLENADVQIGSASIDDFSSMISTIGNCTIGDATITNSIMIPDQPPTANGNGNMYFDTSDQTLRVYHGGQWYEVEMIPSQP